MWIKRLTSIGLLLIALTGLGLLIYPSLSDAWNQRHNTHLIASYADELSEVSRTDYASLWDAALRYNREISAFPGYELPDSLRAEYESVLNVSGLGIMGYVEIPRIRVDLPIYHGTSDGVLQIACGHIEWTNLPIGGEGTHCAISGHRGLASARILTDLPQVREGDLFYIRVLNELLTYEVDQIVTVLPWELGELRADEEQDYFTLITCTPYGVNTHRLLVRGHRVPNGADSRYAMVASDAARIEPLLVAPVLAIPIVLLLIVLVFLAPTKSYVKPKEGDKA